MNRIERWYKIHALLKQARHPVPMQRFVDELGVTRQTVTRDFEYLRDFLGAPIEYDRDANGHRYTPGADAFELPGVWFNASELYALLATEHLLESVQPGVLAPLIRPLKGRIRRLLGEAGARVSTLDRRIDVRGVGVRQVPDETFGTLAEALLNGRRLSFHYRPRSREHGETRSVRPLRLTHYRHNWYLAGWCETRRGLRTFSVDRIDRPCIGDPFDDPPADKGVDRFLNASFGIFSGEARAWAVLQFNLEAARWVAEETWHPDQIGQWTLDGYQLQVPYSDPTELIMDILRHGPDVEVLAPDELRKRVEARLRAGASRYAP